MNSWGYHAIFDCTECQIDLITNKEYLTNFVKDLVKEIDMVAYGEPTVVHFATHDPDKAGYSLVQLIETSSITGHFVDKNGDAYLDIFSCKPFDIEMANLFIHKWLVPKKIRTRSFDRDARF